jgi:predicted NUDIX family phosphoesterase
MEFVYVVPRRHLFPHAYPHGMLPFTDEGERLQFEATVVEHGFYVERDRAERTPEWKQVIPYTLVWRDGEIMLLRRLEAGGEARLHNKYSIGVGGHINPVDSDADSSSGVAESGGDHPNPISAASKREVAEELHITGTMKTRTVGLLNDDSNAVGAVHVGVVQVMCVEGEVEVREVDQLEGRFVTPDTLRSLLAEGHDFETWSALLIEHLDTLLPQAPQVTQAAGH